jgi:hypothetical protein
MLGNSWVAERKAASQEGLYGVSYLPIYGGDIRDMTICRCCQKWRNVACSIHNSYGTFFCLRCTPFLLWMYWGLAETSPRILKPRWWKAARAGCHSSPGATAHVWVAPKSVPRNISKRHCQRCNLGITSHSQALRTVFSYHAIAPAVSRRLPPPRGGPGQISPEYFGFPCQFSFH